jgi:hypothetical protein
MSEESKEVAVQQGGQLAEAGHQGASYIADAGVEAGDILVARLLLMQNTSEAVGEERAKLGDWLNNLTEKVVGGLDKPIRIIPLAKKSMMLTYTVPQGQKQKFKSAVPMTPQLEELLAREREGMEDNTPVRRYLGFDFTVLLLDQIEEQLAAMKSGAEIDDVALPVAIRFKSTGLQAGKKIATHMFKMGMLNRPGYSKGLSLTVYKDKKDTNIYAVPDVAPESIALSDEVKAVAAGWMSKLKTAKVTVIDKGEEEVESAGSAGVEIVPEVRGQQGQTDAAPKRKVTF